MHGDSKHGDTTGVLQGMDAQAILQEYAGRFLEYVMRKPRQRMALPVIRHYGERCSENEEHGLLGRKPLKPAEHLNKPFHQIPR